MIRFNVLETSSYSKMLEVLFFWNILDVWQKFNEYHESRFV